MEDLEKIAQLKAQGFFCSQILMLMGMELQGISNPDLIRSMQSLAGGVGFSGNLCGALTGGACLLGLYAGKGKPEEPEDERLNLMLLELVDWFQETIGQPYGGANCDQILEGKQSNIPLRCPGIIKSVWQKSKDILVEYGFDLNGTRYEE
ncbi:MAG: DVU_1555 family C-GCAxxG-C-C protein [Anaerolineaceae bacterium]